LSFRQFQSARSTTRPSWRPKNDEPESPAQKHFKDIINHSVSKAYYLITPSTIYKHSQSSNHNAKIMCLDRTYYQKKRLNAQASYNLTQTEIDQKEEQSHYSANVLPTCIKSDHCSGLASTEVTERSELWGATL
jgi:hypothetical protein